MEYYDYNDLAELVKGIKGTEKTLKHLTEEGDSIKKYAISALEDYIDTCDKLKKIVVDSGLYGKEFLGKSYCIIERDMDGIIRHRTSWSCGDTPEFEFDLLYGDTYGSNVCYKMEHYSYVDEYESAKEKIEYIKSHTWSPEGYACMKRNADLLKMRIRYNIKDIKRILNKILNKNRETIAKVSEYSGASYEKVGW